MDPSFPRFLAQFQAAPCTLQSQIVAPTAAGGERRLLYSTRDQFSETLPAVAVAVAVSDSLRLGISAAADVVSYTTNDSLTSLTTGAASQDVFTRGGQINADAVDLIFGLGAQYDLSERWRLALAFKTPSLGITGGSKITVENVASSGGVTTDTALYDPDARFAYSRPLQASVGVAYLSRIFELEADVRFHAALGPYSVFSASRPAIRSASSGGGAPTASQVAVNDVVNQFRSVANLAIGAKYALSDEVDLHGGFFASRSPLVDGDNAISRKVDLYGITLGASLRIQRFSGSLGVAYEFGKSDPYRVPTSDLGEFVETTVNVSSIGVLYAVSFTF